MYKDNGTVDVELLADVGYITNRARSLDEKLTTLAKNPLDANTAQIFCYNPNVTTSTAHQSKPCSVHQREAHNCIGSDNIITSRADIDTSERILNEFYETHQKYHQDRERDAIEKHFREKAPSKLFQLIGGGDNTMNNTNRAEINTISEVPSAAEATANTENETLDTVAEDISAQDDYAQRPSFKRQQTGRGSFSQPMPEIQISISEDTDRSPNKAEHGFHQSPISPNIGGTGSCGHYCGGWQSSICTDQLNDEDLRKLVLELKQRVEFTERMNWLCE